jgi:hypothetical protein
MTDDGGLPHIFTESAAEWAGLSIDDSDKVSVNFLKFIGTVIDNDCDGLLKVAEAYNETDGTLVVKHNTAAPTNSPLTGIYYIFGTTTANMNDGNSMPGNPMMSATTTAGTQWGMAPHNFTTNVDIKGHIWMQMVIGIDETFITDAANDFGPYSWRGKSGTVSGAGSDYDWFDGANYNNGTARASGYTIICGDINDFGAAANCSYRFGVTFVASEESFAVAIHNIATDTAWLSFAGAMIKPADADNYGESGADAAVTGWADSAWAVGRERIFGIAGTGCGVNDDTQGIANTFWSRLGTTSNNSASLGLFVPSNGNEQHHMCTAYYLDPTTLDSNKHRMSRFDAYQMEEIGANKLTTISGKKVHLDVQMHRHTHPWYLIGSLRQMRVGDDGFSRSIFKSGVNQVSCSLGANLNSQSDNIMFDNE